MNRSEDYKADLHERLRSDPEYAAEYLSAAMADSNEAFLVALRDVAEAQKGMANVAREAGLNRESLYRALSIKGNPGISTLDSILRVLGIEVRFVPKLAVPALTGPISIGIAARERAVPLSATSPVPKFIQSSEGAYITKPPMGITPWLESESLVPAAPIAWEQRSEELSPKAMGDQT
jgi:probable addiction module antidote protein